MFLYFNLPFLRNVLLVPIPSAISLDSYKACKKFVSLYRLKKEIRPDVGTCSPGQVDPTGK
jgi:hypothetical protein